MKTWEKILLYPIGLYIWLTDGIKKMSKKWKPAMAMLMVVVMLCGMLPATAMAASATAIKVAGTELSSTGYYSMAPGSVGTKLDSEPASGASGYVHWNQSESILTLYGVTIDGGNQNSGIYAKGDLRIVLPEGTTNSVTSGYTNAITCDRGSVTIGGSGTLTVTGATNGIKANYAVNLSENVNVTVIGNNGCGIVNNPTTFSDNKDPVRIAATATASITGSTYGICVNDGYGGSPIIDSPNAEITGGTAAFSEFPHGAPKLGDKIIALAGSSASNTGVYDAATYSTYKYVKTAPRPSFTVSFDANGGTGTMADATNIYDEYQLPSCGFTAPSDKAFKAWLVGSEEKNPGETITVTANTTVKAVWQDVAKYNLWVGGVQVTSENASNITGAEISGTISYDAATKTLTLNNATVGAYEFGTFWHDTSCIYSEEELTVNLVGNNTLTGSDLGGSSYCIYLDEGNLVFTGNGSLTATSADLSADTWSVPVFADGTITVQDSCTITACCGESDWVARAFYSYASGTKYFLPNVPGILVAGNKNASDATNLEKCNGNPNEFKYLRIAPGYTVTLNTNGGTVNSGKVTCYFVDTGVALPTDVTKSGYRFDGWYDNAGFTGNAVTEISAGATENKEYWAKWTSLHTCDIEPVEKVWPNCDNGGKEAYYKCDACGKFYEDAAGTTEITDIDSWGNLTKLGHTEGTDWETDGECHWHICTVTNCGAVIESSKAFHSSTGANVATCQKKAVCDICGVSYGDFKTHSYTAETKNQDSLKSAGNCRDKAVYWYSCSVCGNVEKNDNHTFTGDKVADTHVGGTELVGQLSADHQAQIDGYTGDTKCLGCGEILDYGQAIPAGAHTPAAAWTTDGEYHWKVCSVENCGTIIESTKAQHTSTGDNVATCQKKAVCDICGVTYGDFTDHDWDTAFEKDATGHWYKCSTAGCTEKKDFAEHKPDRTGGATEEYAVKCTDCGWIIEQQLGHTHAFDKEVVAEKYLASGANCNDPAKYYKSCQCGEKGTETFTSGTANGHTAGAEWKSDKDNHWHICTVAGCGAVIDSSKTAHTPDRAAATETDPIKCSVCGYEIAPALGHTHAHGTTWKSDADNHWNECACGDKANTAAHKDENKDGKCDVCEYNKYTVTYKADGKVVKTVEVEHGKDATAPEIPAKEGYNETAPKWDKDGKNITADTTINAVYTKNQPGTFTSITPTTNAGGGKITDKVHELKEKIPFTQEEALQIEYGADVEVWLEVEDISASVPADDKKEIEKKLGDSDVALYLDIVMFKQVGENEATRLTQLSDKVQITFKLDDSYINTDQNVTRTYSIIHVHDGKAEVITPVFDAATKTLTFETDRFSTYGVVYTDEKITPPAEETVPPTEKPTPPAEIPATGDSFQPVFWIACMTLSIFGIAVLLLDAKRRHAR